MIVSKICASIILVIFIWRHFRKTTTSHRFIFFIHHLTDGIPVRVGLVDPTVGDGKILITEGYEEIHWPGL